MVIIPLLMTLSGSEGFVVTQMANAWPVTPPILARWRDPRLEATIGDREPKTSIHSWFWGGSSLSRGLSTAMTSLIVAASTMVFSPLTSFGEDELAALANGEFKPDLVSSECFATSCKQVTKACVENADCKKGLMCTARCLGDSACITGCFARFGNEVLNDLLQCSIEDYKCINIAIITPGAQPPDEVPLPPKALATTFKPSSMEVPPSPTQTPTLQQKK